MALRLKQRLGVVLSTLNASTSSALNLCSHWTVGKIDAVQSRRFASASSGKAPLKQIATQTMGWTRLESRQLIRITGTDTIPLLQGLLTNDVTALLQPDRLCLYAYMLNKDGRVDYDLVLYKVFDTNMWKPAGEDLLIEVDTSRYSDFAKLLVKYRMRKRCDIVNCGSTLGIYALFPVADRSFVENSLAARNSTPLTLAAFTDKVDKERCEVALVSDARLDHLGARLILPSDNLYLTADLWMGKVPQLTEADYRRSRYCQGVAEGHKEILPSKSLPLECNLDYLNGVSFHKGCYIGQELTARTHHSGVVRKRLMPIIPSSQSDVAYFATAAPDSPILSKDGKSVGKVRAVDGGFGLALMNVADALKDPAHLQLAIDSNNSIPVVTSKPYWWPDSGIEGEIRGFQSTT